MQQLSPVILLKVRGVVAKFLCANNASVSLSNRCLYEKVDGLLTGCRDASHLIDCGALETIW